MSHPVLVPLFQSFVLVHARSICTDSYEAIQISRRVSLPLAFTWGVSQRNFALSHETIRNDIASASTD